MKILIVIGLLASTTSYALNVPCPNGMSQMNCSNQCRHAGGSYSPSNRLCSGLKSEGSNEILRPIIRLDRESPRRATGVEKSN